MSHKKDRHRKKKKPRSSTADTTHNRPLRLEIVLKADAAGSIEAAEGAIRQAMPADMEIRFLHTGPGDVSASDLFLAGTGSGLVIGFNVDTAPGADRLAAAHNVEVRLFRIIYRLQEDIAELAGRLKIAEPPPEITGRAMIIALFKSSRKGIILGCEVREGRLALGDRFRIISAMGPIYRGTIESLQIDRRPINAGKPGQKIGLKIKDFNQAAIGDLVECYRVPAHHRRPWHPRGGVFRVD